MPRSRQLSSMHARPACSPRKAASTPAPRTVVAERMQAWASTGRPDYVSLLLGVALRTAPACQVASYLCSGRGRRALVRHVVASSGLSLH